MSRSAKAQADVAALLRSRHTLLWVTTLEEVRAERALVEAAGSASYNVFFWDCVAGISKATGEPFKQIQDPQAALAELAEIPGRAVLVMRDLHAWVRDPSMLRAVRNAHRRMQSLPRDSAKAVVVLTPSAEVPTDLRGCAAVLDWPLPDREEIGKLLRDTLSAVSGEAGKLAPEPFEKAVDAAVGLSASEAENCFALSLVQKKSVDAARVAEEKRRIVARIPGLAWYDPDPRGLDAIGGLAELKAWLRERACAFGVKARAYGLPAPKGCLLVGVPGGGKSLTAKALAAAWQLPLIRWDLGAMRSKFVGDSEANIRRALQTIESIGACVLWLDEMEKALAGSTGQQGDGGVAADALGQILSWMQDRKSDAQAFVVATCNDVRALPPELLRKGRFDEVWWVDLPTRGERAQILRAALKEFKRELPESAIQLAAAETEGFVGAELAALVPDALFRAFADDERDLTGDDLIDAAQRTVPLSKTASAKIEDLRAWAKGRARPASAPEKTETSNARSIDL